MNILQLLSILLEVGVAIIGVLIGTIKKRLYGWLVALTFSIYVFYDLANYFKIGVSENILYAMFFVASVSIFYGMMRLLME